MAEKSPRRTEVFEIASAVVIALAGALSAIGGYQESLWDGEQAAAYSRSNSLRTDSNRAAVKADIMMEVEIDLFSSWLDARAAGDERLADFYAGRFPPDLRASFAEWISLKPLVNPAAPPSPFAMPSYRPKGRVQAAAMEKESVKVFEEGQRANQISDSFSQATTILSLSLFFAGIGQVFRAGRVRAALLIMAVVACALGALRLFTLPLQTIM